MSNTWVDEFYILNPDAAPVEEIKKAKKETTLPLSSELSAMDFSNKDFYKGLTDEQKKEMSVWVLMRFMSSSQAMPEHHIMMVNDLVNHNFNNLAKHQELQWKLLALCGTKKKQYHAWIAPPKGVKKNKLEEAVLVHYPLMRSDELELFMKINTKEDLAAFFKDNGYDDKQIKELFKSGTKGK